MKRHLFISAIIALFAAITLNAREKQTWEGQPYRYEVIVGVAPILDHTAFYEFISENFGSSMLDLIYAPENGPVYTAGGYSAEFGLNFRNWFTLTFNASASGIWHSAYDEITRSSDIKSGAQLSLMPVARLSWYRGRTVKMYSSLGVGGGLTVYDDIAKPHLSMYFVPVGMQFGNKVFGIVEWGTGINANMQAVRVGIGMKF